MSSISGTPHVEVVTSRMGNVILASTVKPASEQDIQEAKEQFANTGKCDHRIVVDEDCWPYSVRSCYICNAGLGVL